MKGGAYSVVLAAEGVSDARWLKGLFQRALQKWASQEVSRQWLLDQELDALVQFSGPRPTEPWFEIKRVTSFEEEVLGRRLPYGGAVGSGEGRLLARFIRALKALLRRSNSRIDGIIWLRDDDRSGRLPEFQEARAAAETGDVAPLPHVDGHIRLAIGCPEQAIEAWLISGFSPEDDDERARLQGLAAELSFDPTKAPERLLHQDGHPHSAKRVREVLFAEDHDREGAAIEASLDAATQVRMNTGLAAFQEELDDRIFAPMWSA